MTEEQGRKAGGGAREAGSGVEEAGRDPDAARFGPLLSPKEAGLFVALSGEPCCQACGREWKHHRRRCEGSAGGGEGVS